MDNKITFDESNKDRITTELTNIFREVFKDETIIVNSRTTADEIGSWDSLTHMLMIEEVERSFAIKFKLREIVKLKDVGGLIQLIESKHQYQVT